LKSKSRYRRLRRRAGDRVRVKVGDTIKIDDAIATLESDKATMDVPSTVAGVVKEVLVQLGAKVAKAC
jgi:pyruvate/2-oxoglutarate dehydrogenase complex dihydrolipoamide acyltransferase (E2) component